jgi:iron complex outermembrane receptor protein
MARFSNLVLAKTLLLALLSSVYLESTVAAEQQQPLANSLDSDCPEVTEESSGTNNTSECEQVNNQTLIITQRKAPFSGLEPTSSAVSTLDPRNHVRQASSLTELVEGIPGVAENSQPGLYQVISIRGVSRQRILTLVDGVRLSSERRAGVAASFIDPLLLDNVTITRGPISTYYGSGAIGGVTQMSLSHINGLKTSAGYQNSGNEHVETVHWGDDATQIALVNRKANNSEDIQGNELNTHFHQYAGYVKQQWHFDESLLESWMYVSQGNDIGRSNARFPSRMVNVPTEKHRILKAAFTHKDLWSIDAYFHNQSSLTRTLRPLESVSDVESSSNDFGINWQTAWEGDAQSNLLGVDWYSRNQVNIKERLLDLVNNQSVYSQTLRNGVQQELALFYTHHIKFKDYRFQAGGRYTLESASQTNTKTDRDKALTGFVGLAYDFSPEWEFSFNAGNAFRFASLTERFFSGTTARGNVTGNPQLNNERAFNYDLGLQWKNETQFLKATRFVSQFKDYVERVSIDEDRLTFVNLNDGEIEGVEIEYELHFSSQWSLNFSTSIIDGSNRDKQPLADIPSDRSHLALTYFSDQWKINLRMQHRASKTNPGNGELNTSAANLLAFNLNLQLNPEWNLSLYGDNLLDQQFVSSADDLATLAAGRHFGIQLTWDAH